MLTDWLGVNVSACGFYKRYEFDEECLADETD